MPIPRLFCPELAAGTIRLSREETQHAAAALRLRRGAEVVLFDGRGNEGAARITDFEQRQLTVDVSEITRHPFELPCRLTLAVAMPKTPRQGYLIEKCTELGVAAIWPIIAEHSVTKPAKAAVEKWRRRAVEAAKQSRRCWIPEISPPRSFAESLADSKEVERSFLAHRSDSAVPLCRILASHVLPASILAWIGPEGGWSEPEREQAIEAGATVVLLAPTILRTETAAVTVCAAVALAGGPDAAPPEV